MSCPKLFIGNLVLNHIRPRMLLSGIETFRDDNNWDFRMNEKSFLQKTKWKLIWTIGICVVVWIASGLIGFPRIFQWMFIGYVIGGFLFFLLLDARPVKERKGGGAVISVIIFYIILSVIYTFNGYLWPQYDPQEEKDKIAKLMKNVVTPEQKVKDLEAKVGELTKKIEEMQIHPGAVSIAAPAEAAKKAGEKPSRSEEHTSELQSHLNL